jgi:hypothetical protein
VRIERDREEERPPVPRPLTNCGGGSVTARVGVAIAELAVQTGARPNFVLAIWMRSIRRCLYELQLLWRWVQTKQGTSGRCPPVPPVFTGCAVTGRGYPPEGATLQMMSVKEPGMPFSLLAALELAVEAVIMTGIVVVAAAIAAEIAKEQATKPCYCTCLGRPDPNWNPGDKDWGKRNPGWMPHPAECHAACKLNGFSNSQCP